MLTYKLVLRNVYRHYWSVAEARFCVILGNTPTGCEPQPASCSVGSMVSFPGGKPAGAWSWPSTCIQCRSLKMCEGNSAPSSDVTYTRTNLPDFLKSRFVKSSFVVCSCWQFSVVTFLRSGDGLGTPSVLLFMTHVLDLFLKWWRRFYPTFREVRYQLTFCCYRKVQTLPVIKRELKDLRCCDGDAVTLECCVQATPAPDIRWEKGGRVRKV